MDKLVNNPTLIGMGIENRMASITSMNDDAKRMASRVQKAGEDFEGVFIRVVDDQGNEKKHARRRLLW